MHYISKHLLNLARGRLVRTMASLLCMEHMLCTLPYYLISWSKFCAALVLYIRCEQVDCLLWRGLKLPSYLYCCNKLHLKFSESQSPLFMALSVLYGCFVGGKEDLRATWPRGELGHRPMMGKMGIACQAPLNFKHLTFKCNAFFPRVYACQGEMEAFVPLRSLSWKGQ